MRAVASPRSLAPGHDLREQRVVVDGHLAAGFEAPSRRGCPVPRARRGGARGPATAGRRGPGPRRRGGTRSRGPGRDLAPGASGSGAARRHLELQAHEVEAGHGLGHRVLHLQPRVHLEEVEAAVGRHQELDRARAEVAGRARGGDARPSHSSRRCARRERRARRLLDHLLVAALDRALALAEVHARAPCASATTCTSTWRERSTKRSTQQRRRPERGPRLAPRGRERARRSLGSRRTTRMPLPPPPRAGLSSTGQPIRSASASSRASSCSSPS